ncbi:MAG: hypothetical protein ACI9KE_001587 [Polyangiales bacterium]|jgi:hypothetical protein
MNETLAEKAGGWIAILSVVIPSLLASGFTPEWNVLPFAGWVLVSAAGAASGAAIATSRRARGAISGAIGGAGFVLGTWFYVMARQAITGNSTFLSVELLLGGALGAAPGILLYMRWAMRPEGPSID